MNTGVSSDGRNPNRAGSPTDGSRLNTGEIKFVLIPTTAGSSTTSVAAPMTVSVGHFCSWNTGSEHRGNGVGFPTNPGGSFASKSLINPVGSASGSPVNPVNAFPSVKLIANVV